MPLLSKSRFHIRRNIGADALVFTRVTDDVVMIPSLPFERQIVCASEFGYADLIPPDDGGQVLRLRAEPVWSVSTAPVGFVNFVNNGNCLAACK